MDKSWMNLPRTHNLYKNGVNLFLDFAFDHASLDGMILCPCKNCGNGLWVSRQDAYEHLICDGFIRGYIKWTAHGESSLNTTLNSNSQRVPNKHDDMEGLLRDAFGIPDLDNDMEDDDTMDNNMADTKTFCKLIDDSQQPLFPGCEKYTKLSFLVHLLNIKCLGSMSDRTFTRILDLLRDAFPSGVQLPKSYYDTKKFIKEMGFSYEKYDACKNDCMLYWGTNKDKEQCDICKEPRWITPVTKISHELGNSRNNNAHENSKKEHKVAAKVLWHFPLKPRLQRLFISSNIATFMKWHAESRIDDGKMRHPADSPAWKTFDFENPEFAKDPRNVRLGLATDGFNPFKNMSTNYSTWPVVLMPYNLPPHMCMKQPFFMLSLLISGPTEPGNNIDVYLQPLIAELNELWLGVNTFDASTKQPFNMRAALLWTISDLPGHANISSWSTKGYLACPVCHEFTCSCRLENSHKNVYMGHRRFLEENHPYRFDESFNGEVELGVPPPKLTGSMILSDLEGFEIRFGKLVKDNPMLPHNWKKRSIFFELPYWEKNLMRHNLDVMHIEKNVCDNIIGTLLDISGKTKDHVNARLDCQQRGVRPELHPNEDGSLPEACYSLNKKGKEKFCSILKNVKLPDGHASNISRCVQMKPPKIFGLKSHDSHILMEQLLPLCMRKTLPSKVKSPLIKLCRYFKDLCSKELCPRDLVRLESEIAITLSELELIFPPSFFDVMVHLPIHLATEARIADPVHYRWMYPAER
ncbi:hypothetical protein ACJIZ3_003679 [Penstemon smallii]|uniref:Transposase-associated domain-containing protein n=1 Tax=Penstemon smallii TaxID=265156 RepID=A0ABD3U9Z6_9LAMI